LKLTIELDLDNEADRRMLEVVSAFKARQAQGESSPDIKSLIPEQAKPGLPSTQSFSSVHREMTQVANHLGSQVGTSGKMSNRERASVAAKARWERDKAKKEGKPLPPAAKKKSSSLRNQQEGDFNNAEEQDFFQFPTQNAQDYVVNNLAPPPPFPDGREIIDGTWRFNQNGSSQDTEFDDKIKIDLYDADEEEYVREVRRIASTYD